MDKQAYVEEKQKLIDLSEKLGRLEENQDFIDVITKGYLEEEAVRLIKMKNEFSVTATPTTFEIAKFQDNITDKQIDAMYWFTLYLRAIKSRGEMAKRDLEQLNESESQIEE